MRLMQLLVPHEKRAAVLDTLEEEGIDYVVLEEVSPRDSVVVSFPLPVGAVDDVFDVLRQTGYSPDRYATISELDTALTPNIDALEDKYKGQITSSSHISTEELLTTAEELKPDIVTYVALIAMSVIVAVGGLFLDSAVIIVGAMVIAPFGDIPVSVSVGAVVDDREMVVNSAKYQGIGVLVGLLVGILTSAVFRFAFFVPPLISVTRIEQIISFSTIHPLTLAVAVAAGVASATAFATNRSVSIAGVAIAVALIPALATASIALVWTEYSVMMSAFILLLMNLVFINLSAYATFALLGYGPPVSETVRPSAESRRSTAKYLVVLGVFALVAILMLGALYQYIFFQQAMAHGVQEVLTRQDYQRLELVNVQSNVDIFNNDCTVIVTVADPSQAEYPELPEDLERQLSSRTSCDVSVSVQFIEYRREATMQEER